MVAGFGGISLDNRRVLTIVYRMAAGPLAGIAVLTALTDERTPVRWFKACPLVLAGVITLLLVGSSL